MGGVRPLGPRASRAQGPCGPNRSFQRVEHQGPPEDYKREKWSRPRARAPSSPTGPWLGGPGLAGCSGQARCIQGTESRGPAGSEQEAGLPVERESGRGRHHGLELTCSRSLTCWGWKLTLRVVRPSLRQRWEEGHPAQATQPEHRDLPTSYHPLGLLKHSAE